MINLTLPVLVVAGLAGIGLYGVLARRNAVMVLVGAELLLNAGVLLLVLVDLGVGGLGRGEVTDPLLSGQVGALLVITVAAAEIGLALAVVLLLFRTTGSSDLRTPRSLGETARTVTSAEQELR